MNKKIDRLITICVIFIRMDQPVSPEYNDTGLINHLPNHSKVKTQDHNFFFNKTCNANIDQPHATQYYLYKAVRLSAHLNL